MNVAMRLEEVFDLPVGREVIGDPVDLLTARPVHHDIGQEGDELGRGMARSGLVQSVNNRDPKTIRV
jgi:hypothetical protein